MFISSWQLQLQWKFHYIVSLYSADTWYSPHILILPHAEFRHDPKVNLSDACLRYNSLDLDDDYFGCLFKGETIDGTYDLLTLRSKIASLKQGLTVSLSNDCEQYVG